MHGHHSERRIEFLEQKKQAQPQQDDPFGAMGQELPPEEEIPF